MHIPPQWAERVTQAMQRTGAVSVRFRILPVTIEGGHHWEELSTGEGVIVAANHISIIDALYVQLCSPRPLRFFARLWVFGSKFLGPYMAAAGHLPVDPEQPRLSQQMTREALEILRAGGAIGIFPEGDYSAEPRPLRLQNGAGWLSRVSGAPILPVAIHGTAGVLPWYEKSLPRRLQWLRYVLRWQRVRIVIGPPIFPDGRTTDELTEELRAALATQATRARSSCP